MKQYKTVGFSLLQDVLTQFPKYKIIPDENEYVLECTFHGLLITEMNVLEIINGIKLHESECDLEDFE